MTQRQHLSASCCYLWAWTDALLSLSTILLSTIGQILAFFLWVGHIFSPIRFQRNIPKRHHRHILPYRWGCYFSLIRSVPLTHKIHCLYCSGPPHSHFCAHSSLCLKLHVNYQLGSGRAIFCILSGNISLSALYISESDREINDSNDRVDEILMENKIKQKLMSPNISKWKNILEKNSSINAPVDFIVITFGTIRAALVKRRRLTCTKIISWDIDVT